MPKSKPNGRIRLPAVTLAGEVHAEIKRIAGRKQCSNGHAIDELYWQLRRSQQEVKSFRQLAPAHE